MRPIRAQIQRIIYERDRNSDQEPRDEKSTFELENDRIGASIPFRQKIEVQKDGGNFHGESSTRIEPDVNRRNEKAYDVGGEEKVMEYNVPQKSLYTFVVLSRQKYGKKSPNTFHKWSSVVFSD